jgi:plasmid stabilization system protein ParE
MNIVIRRKAADDLESIFSWIAEENPTAARIVIQRLRERIGAPS